MEKHTLNRKALTCFVRTKPRGSIVITKPLALQMLLSCCHTHSWPQHMSSSTSTVFFCKYTEVLWLCKSKWFHNSFMRVYVKKSHHYERITWIMDMLDVWIKARVHWKSLYCQIRAYYCPLGGQRSGDVAKSWRYRWTWRHAVWFSTHYDNCSYKSP